MTGHRESPTWAMALLCIAALTVVSAIWVFVFAQIRHDREQAEASAVRENANHVVAFEQYVTRTIESADLASAYVASRYAGLLEQPGRPARVARIEDSFLRSKGVLEINMLNARGDLVGTNGDARSGPLNGAGSATFQGDLHSPDTRLRVGKPEHSLHFDAWDIILSRRLNHPDGSFAGSLGIHISPTELLKFARNAPVGEDDMLAVIGLDGVTRARLSGRRLSFGEDLGGTEVMLRQARDPDGSYVGRGVLDGKTRYYGQRRLPRYGLFVMSGISQASVLAPVRARSWAYVFGALAITVTTLAAACLLHVLIKRRVRRETEMGAANARLREAQRLAKLGDWRFDPEREEIWLSDDLRAVYGGPAEPGGLSLGEFEALIGRSGSESFRFLLEQVLASRREQECELTVRLESGTVSHRRLVALPSFDAAGALVDIHGTDQDVTTGKRLESLQEQVRHLSRLDAMNALTSTMAHELNQPLTAAGNYLGIGLWMVTTDGEPDKPAMEQALRSANAQLLYAGDVIRRVRQLVSDRQSSLEPVSLSEVVAKAAALVEAARPGLAPILSTELGPDCDCVLADPVQLQQVLVNLMRNARDACRDREARIAVKACARDGDTVEVCIIDNGPGIAGEEVDIFSPFATTKSDGLGLGLAICRTLVEAMAGRIWVAETGAQGTRICFSLLRPAGWRPDIG